MTDRDLAGAVWRKSRYSNGQANCVEVASNLPGVIAIQDSKDPGGGMLRVSSEEWRTFLAQIREGQLA